MVRSPRRTTGPSPQRAARHRRRRAERLIIGGVLVVMATALLYVGRGDLLKREESRELGAGSKEQSTEGDAPAMPASRSQLPVPSSPPLVDDDGQTLWTSPTSGPSLDLSYLPPGIEIVLALRLSAVASHPEGDKVLAALGPLGALAAQLVERRIGLPLREIDCLIIGWRANLDGRWDTTLVATARKTNAFAGHVAGGTETQHAGKTYHVVGEPAYLVPELAGGRVLVVAAPATMREIVELDGGAPPLRPDLERALAHTDASRHVTLLCTPSALVGDGRDVFAGRLAPLHGPLEWFLGDEAQAIALSLHWDDDFFVELLAVPSLDTLPERLADALAGRVAELPQRVEDHVLSLAPQPYGRRVVARLPEMVRKLAAYTRPGYDRDHAVLRAYLPAVAGHNLLLAAELTLAETAARAAPPNNPTAEAISPNSP